MGKLPAWQTALNVITVYCIIKYSTQVNQDSGAKKHSRYSQCSLAKSEYSIPLHFNVNDVEVTQDKMCHMYITIAFALSLQYIAFWITEGSTLTAAKSICPSDLLIWTFTPVTSSKEGQPKWEQRAKYGKGYFGYRAWIFFSSLRNLAIFVIVFFPNETKSVLSVSLLKFLANCH